MALGDFPRTAVRIGLLRAAGIRLGIDSHCRLEINEAFNSEIIPSLNKNHGEDAIVDVSRLSKPIRVFHNYIFMVNMEGGRMSRDWAASSIFVG